MGDGNSFKGSSWNLRKIGVTLLKGLGGPAPSLQTTAFGASTNPLSYQGCYQVPKSARKSHQETFTNLHGRFPLFHKPPLFLQRSPLTRGSLKNVQDYSSKGSGAATCLGDVLGWEGRGSLIPFCLEHFDGSARLRAKNNRTPLMAPSCQFTT